MAFLLAPRGRAVWRTSKARPVLEALGNLEHGCGTLAELAVKLNWPADDVLHALKPLLAGGLVLKWSIYQGEGEKQKRVGIGLSLVSDPNRPDRAPGNGKVLTETGGALEVPLDRMKDADTTGAELRRAPMAGCAAPPPPDAAERDRGALQMWMAEAGAFSEFAAETTIPEGVPYPRFLIGEGMVWGRARALPCGPDQRRPEPADPTTARSPEPIMTAPEGHQADCPAGHGPTLEGRSHYCIVCDRSGSGQDLVGSTPVMPRPGRDLRKYQGQKAKGGAKAGKKSKKGRKQQKVAGGVMMPNRQGRREDR